MSLAGNYPGQAYLGEAFPQSIPVTGTTTTVTKPSPGVIAVPKFFATRSTGPKSVPEEVANLRASSLDYHRMLGQLVIHKHRWNERDVQKGLAERCPFHDDTYGDQSAYDPYCFGTGYLGGYADGTIVPVTLGDSQEDVFRPNAQGVLIHERHPGMLAPWSPEMGDDDLIIVAEFAPNHRDIVEMGDRYILRETTPVTMRGPGFPNTLHMKPYKVSQEAMVDLLPYNHNLYNVPVNFDYTNVPIPSPIPGFFSASFDLVAGVIGYENPTGIKSFKWINVGVNGGTVLPQASFAQGVSVIGLPVGTSVNF